MIPAPFDYHAPASLADAIGLLQQHSLSPPIEVFCRWLSGATA